MGYLEPCDFGKQERYNSFCCFATSIGTMSPKSQLKVPDNLEQCQQMIVQMHAQMQDMQVRLDQVLRLKYGAKAETVVPGQMRLFDAPVERSQKKNLSSQSLLMSLKPVAGTDERSLPEISLEEDWFTSFLNQSVYADVAAGSWG